MWLDEVTALTRLRCSRIPRRRGFGPATNEPTNQPTQQPKKPNSNKANSLNNINSVNNSVNKRSTTHQLDVKKNQYNIIQPLQSQSNNTTRYLRSITEFGKGPKICAGFAGVTFSCSMNEISTYHPSSWKDGPTSAHQTCLNIGGSSCNRPNW